MSETKIKVPARMAKAFQDAIKRDASTFAGLEAALLWQRANLPLPSISDPKYQGPEWATGWNLGVDAVRHMYDAPEPEVPEAIVDLLISTLGAPKGASYSVLVDLDVVNRRIVEAYRRGQNSK